MPYIKDTGHPPQYISRCISRSYESMQTCKAVARHIDIPHTRRGTTIAFEDSYEAYVLQVEKMSPWQKLLDHIYL